MYISQNGRSFPEKNSTEQENFSLKFQPRPISTKLDNLIEKISGNSDNSIKYIKLQLPKLEKDLSASEFNQLKEALDLFIKGRKNSDLPIRELILEVTNTINEIRSLY